MATHRLSQPLTVFALLVQGNTPHLTKLHQLRGKPRRPNDTPDSSSSHQRNELPTVNIPPSFTSGPPGHLQLSRFRSFFIRTALRTIPIPAVLQTIFIFQHIYVTTACQRIWPRRCRLWSFSKFGWPSSTTVDIPGCVKYQPATPSHAKKYTKDYVKSYARRIWNWIFLIISR